MSIFRFLQAFTILTMLFSLIHEQYIIAMFAGLLSSFFFLACPLKR